MKITVLSKIYNEGKLLPFFLKHYSYADEILIYLDLGTDDNSEAIIRRCPQAKIIWAESTGELDDLKCIQDLNEIARNSDADWLILADVDEFIFPHNFADPREVLERADGNLIYSRMWNIYRHETDSDLDYENPSIFQRRHGDADRTVELLNRLQTKPDIIKPEIKIEWTVGNHFFEPNPNVIPSSTVFDGAHWKLVDFDLAVERRIHGRKDRFSEINLKNSWGFQYFNVTREEIIAEYEQHKNCPQVF